MISLQGIYEKGKLKLFTNSSQQIPESSKVILTFLSDEIGKDSLGSDKSEEHDEEYYQSIRQFERVKAIGKITVIDKSERYSFPLNDYSQGGLSFVSDIDFLVGSHISAGITDPTNPEMVLMELEMEVRGLFPDERGYKVGCMFLDSVDEDLWHGLLQYLS